MSDTYTYLQLWQSLTPLYEPGEARAIVRMVLEDRFGMTMSDILCYGTELLNNTAQHTLEGMMQRLRDAEPVQYVLGRGQPSTHHTRYRMRQRMYRCHTRPRYPRLQGNSIRHL